MPIGMQGEYAAENYLRSQGYRLLARNLHLPQGEIDRLMLAPDGRTLVIVEVKTRSLQENAGTDNPRPEVHVNSAKERKLTTLAMQLLRQKKYADHPVRFDVVGVDVPKQGKPIIRHHPGAFEAAWG